MGKAHRVKDLSDKYGKPAWEYSDGSERDEKGHALARIPGGAPVITVETAPIFARIRKEKTAEAIRAAIVAETPGLPVDLPADLRAPAAIGAAAGMIWKDIVMAPPAVVMTDQAGNTLTTGVKVYPRDRLEAWDKLAQRADLLADSKQQADAPHTLVQVALASPELVELVRALQGRQAIKQAEQTSEESDGG